MIPTVAFPPPDPPPTAREPLHRTIPPEYSQPAATVLEKEVQQVTNTTLSKRDQVNILP